MFEHEQRQGKYAAVSKATWSPPPKRQARPAKYYAPFSTRWPALTLIVLVILACIALLEYGIRSGLTLEEKDQQQNHSRLKRQDVSSPVAVVTTSATTTLSVEDATTVTPAAETSSAPDNEYIDPASTSPSIKPTTAPPSTVMPVSSSTTAYIAPITSESTTMTVASSTAVYIVPSTTTPGTSATPVMNSGTTPYIVQISSTTTTAYVQPPSSTTPANPYTVPSSSSSSRTRTTTPIASTSSGVIRTTELNSAYVYTQTTSAPTSWTKSSTEQFTTLITYTTEDASGKPLTTVATATYAVAVMTETVHDSNGGVSTMITTLTSYSGSITPTILAASTSLPTTPPDHQRAGEVELGLAVGNLQYFRAIYLPVLIAVLLKLIWAVVFTSTKMMEPFYLLSREKGASATESLLANYLATSLSVEDSKNMFLSHPVVTLVSIVSICLSALPSIATQSTTVRAIAWCRSPSLIVERCNPMWYLKVDYARAIQAVLSLIVVIIFVVIILSSNRRSGVFSNPSSIATMASLLSSENFARYLQRIDQNSRPSSLKRLLSPYRYMLRQHQTPTGHVRYGIVRESGQPVERRQPNYTALEHPRASGSNAKHPRSTLLKPFLIDTLFLLCILALLGVLVGYYMDGKKDPFNNYFNHNRTSQLVLTAAASLLDIRWKQLEREVRLLTPYRRLFRGSAKPESTILVSQNSTPLTSIFQALGRRNFFHAFVAFVAILSDVLIIAIGGVPFNSAQIWLDFLVSIYTSWAILALMILTVIAIFRWRALNAKMMMPSEPTRPLTVWLMLCNEGNQLCEEMKGYETMAPRERDEKVKLRGGLYWAGWLTQPDGSQRWCLEKESGQACSGILSLNLETPQSSLKGKYTAARNTLDTVPSAVNGIETKYASYLLAGKYSACRIQIGLDESENQKGGTTFFQNRTSRSSRPATRPCSHPLDEKEPQAGTIIDDGNHSPRCCNPRQRGESSIQVCHKDTVAPPMSRPDNRRLPPEHPTSPPQKVPWHAPIPISSGDLPVGQSPNREEGS
ncbi:hypothetical protein AYL99_02184 [Fonsecaea erecta]|uniref:Uncharacterized protein n=1 Tax=Fonsecaea erecta TaxID=1367422 RepID=A0A178ZT27_9EURO|nr:hypothetical protein AYL99_02184 [Fonsecaea erecta]OAP62957.1 hypothetical protein AYL99_02184 [Fonsecaea erecta]